MSLKNNTLNNLFCIFLHSKYRKKYVKISAYLLKSDNFFRVQAMFKMAPNDEISYC